jgi:hypothetical protein
MSRGQLLFALEISVGCNVAMQGLVRHQLDGVGLSGASIMIREAVIEL